MITEQIDTVELKKKKKTTKFWQCSKNCFQVVFPNRI